MVVKASEIETVAKQLEDAMKQIPAQIERLKIEQSLCDQEVSDILHIIEMSNFHAADGYRFCRDLQITLQQRRVIKDELDSLRSIRDKMKTKRSMNDQIYTLSSNFESRKRFRLTRTYTLKVRSDLKERLNLCDRRRAEDGTGISR